MYCKACQSRWPGHRFCPECGGELIDLETLVRDRRIDRLPQFEDLAAQFDAGRNEKEQREKRTTEEDDDG